MYDKDFDNKLSEFQKVINYKTKEVYEDYFINKDGMIINAKNRTLRLMKPRINNWGYYSIGLRDEDGNRDYLLVHKLVAQRFIPNPRGNKDQVNHIDGDKLNNNIDNLEWVSKRENTIHGIDVLKKGTIPTKLYKDDKLVKEYFKRKDLYEFVAEECDLSFDHVRKVLTNQRKTDNELLLRYRINKV